MPTVSPPAECAPSAAASITPPRPPQTRTAPRAAISRPTSNASLCSAAGAMPAPITAIAVRRTILVPRSEADYRGQLGEAGYHEVGRRHSLGPRPFAAADPYGSHPDPSRSNDIMLRSVADEKDLTRWQREHRKHLREDFGIGLAHPDVRRDD